MMMKITFGLASVSAAVLESLQDRGKTARIKAIPALARPRSTSSVQDQDQ